MAIDSRERTGRPRELRTLANRAEQRSLWRVKLAAAEQQYAENRSAGHRAEYLRILRIFKGLVLYDSAPQE
jgi:hypothetical protein